MGFADRLSVLAIALSALAGCAHSTLVPFQVPGSGIPKAYPPTDPKTVGIYRSTHPFAAFIELGLIAYRSSSFDLEAMYDQLRKDASAVGAQAVVDVKVTGETHTDYEMQNVCSPQTSCDAYGNCTTQDVCHTEQVPTQVTTFLITGSMIREKP